MKKTYRTPCAKVVDFNYDEQVVATSNGCYIEHIISRTIALNCTLREGASTYAMIIGCDIYWDDSPVVG